MRGHNLLCDSYVCNDVAGGVPFWAVLLLVILLALLLAAFVAPRKEPATLKKAVDEVLEGFQTQAQTWGDKEAETAFANARNKVAAVVDKYQTPRLL